MQKIGIIGAGLSSLYAACFLAKKGHKVEVFEKNGMPGGRSQYFKAEGFTFDMGPSWYWMPEVIDNLFEDLGEKREDYFQLTRLDPAYTVYWNDKTATAIPEDYNELLQLFDSFEPGGAIKLKKFLADAKIKYDTAMGSFIEYPGLKIGELVKFKIFKEAMKLDVLKSVEKDIAKRFSSEKARNILNFPVLFLGERPDKIPSMYTLMNYADLELGTWYPEGGMNALAQALETVAKKYGAQFHYKANVEAINTENKSASGLTVNGDIIDFDQIVAGADYNFVEQKLIPKEFRRYDENYWDKRKMAPSALIFYLGFNKRIEKLDHHNLFFDELLSEHGKEIYENPKWPTKPLFYACAPAKTDISVAPENHENLMALIPIAPDLEDNEEVRNEYLDKILDRLEIHCGEMLKNHIIYKKSFCVNDFKSAYNSYKGNAYGLANTLRQTANLKPKMKSKLKNVYFCGQLTVPGPGIPPALISGKIAAKQLLKEL
ncbi:MAG: phytoene desaturase family protein [Crocinitomicaceae bacterium]|nr:phytoene desaturase family protein [Crocinitomicaceae bacterium]